MVIERDTLQFISPSLFQAQNLVSKVVFCFFSPERLAGKFELSRQKYIMPPIDSISVEIDGKPLDNFRSMYADKISTGQDNYLFVRLFTMMQQYYANSGCRITKKRFLKSCYLFCIDTTTSLGVRPGYLPLVRSGDMRLIINFKEALASKLVCLAYGSAASLLSLDKNRVATVSYRR